MDGDFPGLLRQGDYAGLGSGGLCRVDGAAVHLDGLQDLERDSRDSGRRTSSEGRGAVAERQVQGAGKRAEFGALLRLGADDVVTQSPAGEG